MVAVAPRPSPGGALLYVRCFLTAAPAIGGNCTTRGFDTPTTRRLRASCSAKPPPPPSWSAPAGPEGPAPVPMSGARALRPATGTRTTPEHNTTRPTTTAPGPLGTKLSLHELHGTLPVQNSPCTPALAAYPVQNSPRTPTLAAYSVQNSPSTPALAAYPVQNSPSTSRTAYFRYKTLPARVTRPTSGTKLSQHTHPRRMCGTKLSPHTRNSSIWRFFCMQGEFYTVLTAKKLSRENFVPNARQSRGKPRQHNRLH